MSEIAGLGWLADAARVATAASSRDLQVRLELTPEGVEHAVPAREPKHLSILQKRLRNAKRRSATSLKAARGIT